MIKQQVKKRSSRLLTEMDSETAQVKLSLSQVVEAVEQKHSLAQARSFKRYSPERSLKKEASAGIRISRSPRLQATAELANLVVQDARYEDSEP